MNIPETLRDELRGWGFRERLDGEFRLSEDGSTLIYENDGSEYTMAESPYFGVDTDPERPFLAVVLDVLLIAGGHDHHERCCRAHGTHVTPHRGCILR